MTPRGPKRAPIGPEEAELRRRARAMKEAELQDAVIEFAHLHGWAVAHFRPARTAHGWVTPVAADGKGWLDLALVRDRVVFSELKRQTEGLRDEQAVWARRLMAAGAEVYVWRPMDWLDGTIDRVLAESHPGPSIEQHRGMEG